MGAKQRAQARSKSNKASKRSQKGSPFSQKQSSSSISVQNLDPMYRRQALQGWHTFAPESAASSAQNGFSMAQEAQGTPRHINGWGNIRLRDNNVAFVSAGNLVREELPSSSNEKEEEGAQIEILEEDDRETANPPSQTTPETQVLAQEPEKQPVVTTPANETLAGESDLVDIDSDSSEADEVVFHGRGNLSKSGNNTMTNGQTNSIKTSALSASKPVNIPLRSQQLRQGPVASSSEGPSLLAPRRNRAGRLARRRNHRPQAVSDEENALMEDYIANMAVDDEDEEDEEESIEPNRNKPQRRNETFRFYDGAGEDNAKVKTKTLYSKEAQKRAAEATVWNSDDLGDFDDLATSDEDIEQVGRVLRHRERTSGLQYLVTAVGKDASDAKWLLRSKLVSVTATEGIRTYHEIQARNVEIADSMSDDSDPHSSDDDEALEDVFDDFESEDEEQKKIQSRKARMTDEQIARALAKQEELGIDADDLILFDGQEEDDNFDTAIKNGENFVPFSMNKNAQSSSRGKKNRRQRDSFPSGEAFADALHQDPYGGFDVMDFERPSVRPKRKGKGNDFDFSFGLSDEELEENLRNQFQKDRSKKAERRREKMEALEAQLLVAAERNHPAAIRAEIRQFLISESHTLKLAPMDAPVRAGVHRLAKALKMTSRSEGKDGKGVGRYPVLTKTIHTPYFDIDNIWEIDNLLNQRKWFPNNAFKGPRVPKMAGKRRGGGGGGGGADAALKNGDIVGAWAPELGADNIGRAMLEKMGWRQGTGIGAVGNEGSAIPVQQVVKTNRAGLG